MTFCRELRGMLSILPVLSGGSRGQSEPHWGGESLYTLFGSEPDMESSAVCLIEEREHPVRTVFGTVEWRGRTL